VALCLVVPILLLLAGVLAGRALDDDDDHQTTAEGTAATQEPGAETDLLGPIVLPPPTGSAPRTRPLLAVLMSDPSATSSRSTLEEEVAVWRDYVDRHGLPDDRIAIVGTADPVARRADDTALDTIGADLVSGGLGAPAPALVDQARWLAGALPTHDHQMIAVTGTGAGWSSLLPPPPPTVPDRAPRATARDMGSVVVVGATERGAVASALARAWVAGTGGGWTGG
jgi:hypothetical protein